MMGVPKQGRQQQKLLVLACAAALAGLAAAYPELFVENNHANGCLSHPTQGFGAHDAPVPDTSTSITLSQKGSRAPVVTAACPGVAYDLVVDYGVTRRRTLVTTSAGQFGSPGSLPADPQCPNRAASGSGSTTYTNTLTIPCDAKGPRLSLVVTSAGGSSDRFHKASTSLPLSPVSQCPDSTCPGAGASPAAAAAAAGPAAAAAKPTPAATRAPTTEGDPAAAAAAAPSAAAAAVRGGGGGSGSCGVSSYQYACAVDADSGAKLHYTLSDSPTPPENACTAAAAAGSSSSSSSSGQQQYLHMLLESPARGYSGVGFPQAAGRMFPADSVIGYVDAATGRPVVSAYYLTDYAPTKSAQNSNGLGWATHLGAARPAGSNGPSLLCFSRAVDAPAAAVAKRLDTSDLKLNWVGSPGTSFDTPHDLTHSLTLNAADGTAVSTGSSSSKLSKQLAHGALMLLAFSVFMPLGTLMARHKWVMGDKEKGGIHPRWFHIHRAVQTLAVLLALAGFILALVSFTIPWTNMATPGSSPHSLYNPHRVLGVVVMGLTLLQVVGGIVRPDLSHRRRLNWRKGHQAMGWLALAAGIVVVFMGAVLMHDMAGAPYVNWLLPICLFLGLMVAAGAVGEVWKQKLQRRGHYCPKSHSFGQLPSGGSSNGRSSRGTSADAEVMSPLGGK